MSFTYLNYLGPGHSEVFRVHPLHPDHHLVLVNRGGQAKMYEVGFGRDGFNFADPTVSTLLTGAATFTAGDTHVTGAGTAFDTELAVGSMICLADGKIIGQVESIESATSLYLCDAWSGATAAGAAFYDVSPTTRTLAAGASISFHLPAAAPDGSPVIFRDHVRVLGLGSGELEVALMARGAEVIPVRSNLTDATLAS